MLFCISILIALIALSIGFVGKFCPTLFLKIPNVGFLFWLLTGHPLPPYFTFDAWKLEEARTWLRDGDAVISVAPKSGTTWLLYCTHQIRVKGEDWDFKDVSYSTPWVEFIQKPGHTWADTKELMNTTVIDGKNFKDYWDHSSYPYRIFKSHASPLVDGATDPSPFQVLPVKEFPKVKFIAMARNGLDVTASLVPFFTNHNDEFRKIWGGFPPDSSGDIQKDAADRLSEVLPGGTFGHFFFGYVKDWWPWRHEPNVLLMHFSDMKNDLRGGIMKLAKFLEVELSGEELEKVEQKCSYKHMKENPQYFQYLTPFSDDPTMAVMKTGTLVNKGVKGQGKLMFTEEQKQRFHQAEEDYFTDPQMKEWARNGGTWTAM